MAFDVQEFVRVENLDDKPLTLGFHNRRYVIKPGSDGFVPLEAVCIMFGDPRSQLHGVRFTPDEGGEAIGIPPRQEIINRLELLWGHLGANTADEIEKHGHVLTLRERMPNVKVYTTDGTELTLPADDPNCQEPSMPLSVTVASDDLSVRMAQLERQLSALRAMSDRAEAQVVAETEEPSALESDIKEDGDDGPSMGSRRRS